MLNALYASSHSHNILHNVGIDGPIFPTRKLKSKMTFLSLPESLEVLKLYTVFSRAFLDLRTNAFFLRLGNAVKLELSRSLYLSPSRPSYPLMQYSY